MLTAGTVVFCTVGYIPAILLNIKRYDTLYATIYIYRVIVHMCIFRGHRMKGRVILSLAMAAGCTQHTPCMHAFICGRQFPYILICVHACIYMRQAVPVHPHMRACTHSYAAGSSRTSSYACMHAFICGRQFPYILICVHACIHMRQAVPIHPHMRACMHAARPSSHSTHTCA